LNKPQLNGQKEHLAMLRKNMESKGNELKNVPAMPPIIATVYVHEASG
jgi:hypothetical protein